MLSVNELVAALRAGSVMGTEVSTISAALIHSLFAELDPALILQCAIEANTDIAKVDQLYREALSDALPRVKEWEQSVEHFL
jgi:hypothetical protein